MYIGRLHITCKDWSVYIHTYMIVLYTCEYYTDRRCVQQLCIHTCIIIRATVWLFCNVLTHRSFFFCLSGCCTSEFQARNVRILCLLEPFLWVAF